MQAAETRSAARARSPESRKTKAHTHAAQDNTTPSSLAFCAIWLDWTNDSRAFLSVLYVTCSLCLLRFDYMRAAAADLLAASSSSLRSAYTAACTLARIASSFPAAISLTRLIRGETTVAASL